MAEQPGRTSGFRFERKFVTNQLNSSEIEMIVRQHPAFFKEIYWIRQVNNIYFDTPGLQYYHDNISGAADRKKVRIRWYGEDLQSIIKPVLEFKLKKGLVGWKLSYLLENFDWSVTSGREWFKRLFESSNLPAHIIASLDGLEPMIMNNYTRKYFQSHDRNFRFTIDSQLNYFDFRSRTPAGMVSSRDFWSQILELKYNQEFDQEAQAVVRHLPLRVTKSSKYVNAIMKFRPDIAV